MKFYRPLSMLMVSVFVTAFHTFATGTVFVYNSFGPGNTYSITRWLVEGSAATHGYQGHAEFFVPNIPGYLSQIQLATKVEGGGLPWSNLFIAQDNGGIPGAIVESFTNVPDANGVVTINSVTSPLLHEGQKYWLCDEPVDQSTYTGWYLNNQGLTGNDAAENAEWSWYNLGASSTADSVFSISVVPVPEPSSAGLVVLGASLLAVQRRRSSPRLRNYHS